MLEDNNASAYSEVKGIPLTYVNCFVVTLTNGFAEEGSGTVYELQEDAECRIASISGGDVI